MEKHFWPVMYIHIVNVIMHKPERIDRKIRTQKVFQDTKWKKNRNKTSFLPFQANLWHHCCGCSKSIFLFVFGERTRQWLGSFYSFIMTLFRVSSTLVYFDVSVPKYCQLNQDLLTFNYELFFSFLLAIFLSFHNLYYALLCTIKLAM